MVPVHDVPAENVGTPAYDSLNQIAYIKYHQEFFDWLAANNLPDDIYSDSWTAYHTYAKGVVDFFFEDPNIAMLFKLTWA